MTYQDALKARARIAYGQVKTAAEDDQAFYDQMNRQMAAQAMHDTMIEEIKGQGAAEERQRRDIAEADAANKRNWAIGAGAVGGLGVGGATYGITGLFPSLRKRRLLRALIALGAGAAGGVGAGMGAAALGLNSSKLKEMGSDIKATGNKWYSNASDYLKNLGGAFAGNKPAAAPEEPKQEAPADTEKK